MTIIRELRKERQEQVGNLSDFVQQHNLSLELASELMKFATKHQYEPGAKIPEDSVQSFKNLPVGLQRKLHQEMYLPTLVVHPFFDCLSRDYPMLAQNLCQGAASIVHSQQGDEVFAYGDAASHLFFITDGKFEYMRLCQKMDLACGSWLGEPGLWMQGWLRRGTLFAVTVGDLVAISYDEFMKTVEKYTPGRELKFFIRAYASLFLWASEDGFTERASDDKDACTESGTIARKSKFASLLESKQEMAKFSDLWGSEPQVLKLVERAQQHAANYLEANPTRSSAAGDRVSAASLESFIFRF